MKKTKWQAYITTKAGIIFVTGSFPHQYTRQDVIKGFKARYGYSQVTGVNPAPISAPSSSKKLNSKFDKNVSELSSALGQIIFFGTIEGIKFIGKSFLEGVKESEEEERKIESEMKSKGSEIYDEWKRKKEKNEKITNYLLGIITTGILCWINFKAFLFIAGPFWGIWIAKRLNKFINEKFIRGLLYFFLGTAPWLMAVVNNDPGFYLFFFPTLSAIMTFSLSKKYAKKVKNFFIRWIVIIISTYLGFIPGIIFGLLVAFIATSQ
ncbi:MAG: hypothetical protein JJ837_01805 [Prochlorococcus marinus XMU1428]|nr:hypothetical protein [Prochlorococcus marinus XMU1428]